MKYCKKCGKETDRNSYGRCKACACLATKEWVLKNKDRKLGNNEKWAKENKEKMDAYKAKYRQENKKKCVSASIASRAKKPHVYKEYQIKYLSSDHGKEVSKKRSHARRARVAGAGGTYSVCDISFIREKQKGKCVCCRVDLSIGMHIDHIMPLALGGKNDRSNLQLLCPTCNLQKSAKHPVDFMQSKGFLI